MTVAEKKTRRFCGHCPHNSDWCSQACPAVEDEELQEEWRLMEEQGCPVCFKRYTIDQVFDMADRDTDNLLCEAHLRDILRKSREWEMAWRSAALNG